MRTQGDESVLAQASNEGARFPRPGEVWSLWDMLSLNAAKFLDTVREINRLKTIIETNFDEEGKAARPEGDEFRIKLAESFREMGVATEYVGARVASIAAYRTSDALKDTDNDAPSFQQIRDTAEDIESRLRDELSMISFVVFNPQQVAYFGDAHTLVKWNIAQLFPSAMGELEEAAKCLAMSRPTASAFHSMRFLEIGLKAFAKSLGVDDPTKPAEKNWAVVLEKIKTAVQDKYPAKKRQSKSEGALADELYTHLDAVRNPWRNATMHVDAVYTEAEAQHILACVNAFMEKLAGRCNEEGTMIADLAVPLAEQA